MKSEWRVRLLDSLAIILGTIITFLVVNGIHFVYFEVSVIFYACLIDVLIASTTVLTAIIVLRKGKWATNGLEIVLSAIVGALFTVLYSLLGPTVIDRSLSIYIIEKIDQRGGAVAEDAIPAIFIEEYMSEYRLVDVRLTEQLRSRTLTLDHGCLRLTSRGRALAGAMKFYRAHFLPKRRVLRDEVTDQLTHPFADAPQRVATACPA